MHISVPLLNSNEAPPSRTSANYFNTIQRLLLLFTVLSVLQWWMYRQELPGYLVKLISGKRHAGIQLPAGNNNDRPLDLCRVRMEFLANENNSCSGDLDFNTTNTNLLRSMVNSSIAIIGDSRMRDLFVYLRSILLKRPFHAWPFQEDVSYCHPETNLSLNFFWNGFPDKHLQHLLRRWRKGIPPEFVILGIGVWSAYRFGPAGINAFRLKLYGLADTFDSMRDRTTAIWLQTVPGTPIAISPNRTALEPTNRTVEKYGDLLSEVGRDRNFPIWSSAHNLAVLHPEMYRDKVHPGILLIEQFACQLLSAISPLTDCDE